MRWLRRPARRWAVALVAGLLLSGCGSISADTPGGAAQPAAEASAAARCAASPGTWTATEPASPGSRNNDLTGVAAVAADNVWAVGSYAGSGGGQTLTEHWNGATWSVVTSPDPGGSGDSLSAVSALSPSGAWAAGESFNGGETKTLIARWNGTAWQQVPSPSPGTNSYLTGVQAVSATDAWAVGYYNAGSGTADSSLILHWNGTSWAQVPSPSPGASTMLNAVTVLSATSAWAVGSSGSQQPGAPFILHWDGTAWAQEQVPAEGTGGELHSVAATSATDVWAAGGVTDTAGEQGLFVHWNGTAWTRTPVPGSVGRGMIEILTGVAATSPASAWAVGYTSNGASSQSLILHWNGTAWAQAASPSPNPNAGQELSAVAASSPASTWAVGQIGAVGGDDAFTVRYCPPAGDQPASAGGGAWPAGSVIRACQLATRAPGRAAGYRRCRGQQRRRTPASRGHGRPSSLTRNLGHLCAARPVPALAATIRCPDVTSEREELTWQGFGDASRELARAIAGDGFRPDLILAIARGGFFLAAALGYALSVKNLHVVNVEFYNGVGRTLDMPVMLPPVPQAVDFSRKKVLIADDVADSGKTLELVHGFVRDHVAESRTVVVYEKPSSIIKPHYVWRRTAKWINFPWSSQPPVLSGGVAEA